MQHLAWGPPRVHTERTPAERTSGLRLLAVDRSGPLGLPVFLVRGAIWMPAHPTRSLIGARSSSSLCTSIPLCVLHEPVLQGDEKVQLCVLLLPPDQQGCLQRRFPPGQLSLPPSPLPRGALHHHRHRRVRRGGGGTHRLPLQRGPRVAAACTPAPSPAASPPGIELSCGVQGASARKGYSHGRTQPWMPCAGSFPFQTNSGSLEIFNTTWIWSWATRSRWHWLDQTASRGPSQPQPSCELVTPVLPGAVG